MKRSRKSWYIARNRRTFTSLSLRRAAYEHAQLVRMYKFWRNYDGPPLNQSLHLEDISFGSTLPFEVEYTPIDAFHVGDCVESKLVMHRFEPRESSPTELALIRACAFDSHGNPQMIAPRFKMSTARLPVPESGVIQPSGNPLLGWSRP